MLLLFPVSCWRLLLLVPFSLVAVSCFLFHLSARWLPSCCLFVLFLTDVHHETKTTQWDPPNEVPGPAVAPTAPPPYEAVMRGGYSDPSAVVTATAVVDHEVNMR